MATKKKGYEIPQRDCCGLPMRAVAQFDEDDGVYTYLECQAGGSCTHVDVDWPFRERQALWEDFQRIGFLCEQ